MKLVVISRHWTVRQLEAAIDALGELQSGTIGLEVGQNTILAIAYEAMVRMGVDDKFKLEAATDDELGELMRQHGFADGQVDRNRLLEYARSVEALHGITEDDIPF